MTVYCIEEECADGFYGFFISDIYSSKAEAEKAIACLSDINKGITYRLNEWEVRDTFTIEDKEFR